MKSIIILILSASLAFAGEEFVTVNGITGAIGNGQSLSNTISTLAATSAGTKQHGTATLTNWSGLGTNQVAYPADIAASKSGSSYTNISIYSESVGTPYFVAGASSGSLSFDGSRMAVSNVPASSGDSTILLSAKTSGGALEDGTLAVSNLVRGGNFTFSGNGLGLTNLYPDNLEFNSPYYLSASGDAQFGGLIADSFTGNGAGLTNLSASALTGALPAISGAALTGLPMGENTNTYSLLYTNGTNVVLNFALGAGAKKFKVTLTNTTYFAAPLNMYPLAEFAISVVQDSTGGRACSFDPAWYFPNGNVLTITTNASRQSFVAGFVGQYGTNPCAVQTLNFTR